MNQPTCEELRAFEAALALAARVLRDKPSADLLTALAGARHLLLEEPFSTLAPKAAGELSAYLAAFAADGDAADEQAEACLHEVKQDYAYLFYQISMSGTSPYESVYRTIDRTMFGPTTLEVRAAYRSWGLELPTKASEPDDHFGLEASFVAYLLGQAADALENADSDAASLAAASDSDVRGAAHDECGSADTAARALAAACDFLSDHLLVFAPVYLTAVEGRARTPLYRCTAPIAWAALETLAQRLGARASAEPVLMVDTSE